MRGRHSAGGCGSTLGYMLCVRHLFLGVQMSAADLGIPFRDAMLFSSENSITDQKPTILVRPLSWWPRGRKWPLGACTTPANARAALLLARSGPAATRPLLRRG